jgi:hypothetical protein
MEPEVLLSYSPVPATRPYPDAVGSSPHTIFLRSIIRICMPTSRKFLFVSGFLTKIFYAFLNSPYVLHALPILLNLVILIIFNGVQIMRIVIMRFYSSSCYFLFLRSKYYPQHTLFKLPLHLFFLITHKNFRPCSMKTHESVYQISDVKV